MPLFAKVLTIPFICVQTDDRRLVRAGTPVLFFSLLVIGMQISFPFFLTITQILGEKNIKEKLENTQIYPVLIKQAKNNPKNKKEIKALSDKDVSGQGGITAQYGFHTFTSTDVFSSTRQYSVEKKKRTSTSSKHQDKTKENLLHSNFSGKDRNFRIPSNYRFRQDFLLRFDGSSLLSMASQKLAGYEYFRKMIQEIRMNFAPPGVNYMYRDQAGYVMNQAIQPQVVQIAFSLDEAGNVSDVRTLDSIGQSLVDEACLNSLRDKNFGKPPPEIFKKGNIFGINFVFPKLKR